MINANSAGRPPAGVVWRSTNSRLDRFGTSFVASTTRPLIDAMTLVKVVAAVALSAAVVSEEREAAVELMTAVYRVMSVKRVSMRAMAAGSSAGLRRLAKTLSGAGAARARGAKELAMARQVKKDFMLKEVMVFGVLGNVF